MEMPERIHKFIKTLGTRMYAYRDNKDKEDIAEQINASMFLDDLQTDYGQMYKTIRLYSEWVKGKVVGVDIDLIWGNKIIPLRFITQNPDKRHKKDPEMLNKYAALDQAGHVIVWVLRRLSDGHNTEYMGRIQDGEYYRNGSDTPVIPTPDNTPDTLRDYVAELVVTLPHIKHDNIDAVVKEMGKMGVIQ